MGIQVKLYGLLGRHVKDYDHGRGIALDFETGLTPATLLSRLGIPQTKVGMVTVNGKLARGDSPIPDQGLVKYFHPLFGG